MATAENGAAPALGTVPAELMNLVPPTEKIGEVGRISHPYDSIYFTCPPERKYILSKAHDEADGIVYKPRPLSLDGYGLQPFSQGALGFHSNEEIWHKANEYRQCHPLEAAQVRTDPQTYEDLYDYFDGYDLYFLGVHNALNVIKALVQQNKLLDPFIQQDKRKEMNEFLDEWMAADPEAEKRLLSWDWEVDPSARAVLDGSDMVAKLGHLEEEDKLLFSTLIASRCENAQLAREALRPMVVDGSSDGSLGADGMLCHDGDSANAGAPIPLPDGTAGPLPSAPVGAQMPMMATAQMPIVPAVEAPMVTTATSVSAPKYAFNGKMSTKLSRPAQSSQNNLSTDCKHPSAASISPQRLRMKLKLRPGNTQMAHGPSIGRPEFGYHGGHHPEATPTKPPRHGPMQRPQGQMLGGPFYSQGHVGFNNQDLNNRAWMPHGLPQPGVLQQPVGHQGGTGREFSTASMPMPAPSPNQGLQTIGCHGDVHSRTAPNYQQASPPRRNMSGQLQQVSPPRFQMPGQLQQVSPPRFQMPDQLQQASPPHGRAPGHPQQTPSTRFTGSQRRASGSGPSTKNCPPGNGAGWALSEQQDSIHGQKFVYNKANTGDGPKNRRNNTLGNQSPSDRKQQAGNDKPAAAAAATAHQDTKHPNKNGGGNGYVRPPPPTKETCRNWDRSNRVPSVECPCPTCLQRSRNITVAVMGGGFLDRSDEGALRKHFGQWGQIETVIFPRPAPGFQNGFQGQRPTSRAYITYTSDTVPPVVVEEANGQLCPGVRGALRVLHPQNSKYFTGVKTSPRHPSHGGRPAVSGPAPQYHQPGLPSLAGILSPPLEPSNLAIGGGSIGSHPRPLPMPPVVPTGLNQGLPQYPQLNNSVRQIGEHLALTGPASLPALPPRPGVPMLPAPGIPESATSTAAQHEEKPAETSEAQQPRENQDEADEQSQPSEKPQESGEAQETSHPPSSDAHDNPAEQGDRKASPPGMHRGLSVIISEDKVATPSLSTGNSTIIMTPAGSDKSNDSNTQPASQLEVPLFAEENSGTVVVHRRGKPHGSIPKEWRTDTSAAESNHADGYMGDSEAAKSSMKPSDGGHDKEGDKVKPASKKKGNNKKPKNKTQEAGKNPQGGQNAHDGQGMSATDGSAAGNGAAGPKKVAANKKNKSGKFAKRSQQEDLTSEGARAESRAATTISSGRSTPALPHRADEPQGDKAQGKKKRKQQQQQQRAPTPTPTPTPEPESNKTDDAVISKAQTPEKGGDEGDAQDDLLVRKNRGGDLLSMSPFAAQKYEIDRLHASGGGGSSSSAREPSSSSSTLRAKSLNKASGAASLAAAAGTADGNSKPRHMVRGGSTLPRGFDPYPRIPTVAAAPRTAATPSSTGDKATAAEPAQAAKGKAVEGGADEAKPAAQKQQPSQAKNTPPATPVSSPKASDAAIAHNDDALPPSPPSSVKCQAAALNPTAKPFVLSSPVGPSDGGKKKKNRKQSNKGGDKDGSVAAAAPPPQNQRGRNFMGMRLSGFTNYGTLASGFGPGGVWEERGGEQQQQQQIAGHHIYKSNHKEAQVPPSSKPGVSAGIDKYLGSAAGGGGDNGGEDDKGETEMPTAVDHDAAAQQEEQLGQSLLPEQQKQQQQQQSDQDNEQQQQQGQQQDGQDIATAERDGAYETAAAKMADWQQQHKTRASSGGSAKARPAPGAESGEHHSRPHQRTGSGRNNNNNNKNNNGRPAATPAQRPQQQQARNPPVSPASSTTLSTGSGSGSKSATATARGGSSSMKGSVGGALRPDSPPAAAAAAAAVPAKPAVRVHSSIELAKALKNHKARIGSSGGSKA
ncbi:hypothetical protein RB596_007165 [Gaeumannomyces avenae]